MSEEQFDQMRRDELDTILTSTEYRERIDIVANSIFARGNEAANEAEIESEFDFQFRSLFHDFFSHLGFTYIPEKETAVSNSWEYHRPFSIRYAAFFASICLPGPFPFGPGQLPPFAWPGRGPQSGRWTFRQKCELSAFQSI